MAGAQHTTQDDGSTRSVVLARLEDQLAWFTKKSTSAQSSYKWLKMAQIIVAATVPVAVLLPDGDPVIAAVLSAAVVVMEGLQQLFQWQSNWLRYRTTAEALVRERYLFLAGAGPYRDADSARLLAERVEDLIAQENRSWMVAQTEQSTVKGGS